MKKEYEKYQKYYNEEDEKKIKNLLIGRKVKVIDNDGQEATLLLDNGTKLRVIANEGCGGCSSGWYSINKLNEVDNAITNVEFTAHSVKTKYGEDYSYNIFVFCEDTRIHLLDVTGDDGNGYYGTGYTIHVLEEIIED